MKKVYILALSAFLSISHMSAQEQITASIEETTEIHNEEIKLDWEKTFKKAQKRAKKENKPILLYFTGSDWCGPCIKLDRNLFHTQKFADYADKNLILYMADFPRNKDLVEERNRKINTSLREKYNKKKKFPTLLMLNHKGKVLGKKQGMYMLEYYYPFFDEILRKHY